MNCELRVHPQGRGAAASAAACFLEPRARPACRCISAARGPHRHTIRAGLHTTGRHKAGRARKGPWDSTGDMGDITSSHSWRQPLPSLAL